MCDPVSMAVASFGLQAASANAEYQGQKKAAQAQAAANDRAARDANIAYGEDLTRLEAERIVANEKSAREKFKAKRDKLDALATAQANAGEGKGDLIGMLRDVGFDADLDTNIIDAGIDASNQQVAFGRDDAYAAMRRTIAGLPPVTPPSKLGLMLQIGSAGVGSYSKYKKGDYGKV